MNRTVKALLVLLRAGLWNKFVDDLSLFPLSAEEWETVHAEARRQTVTGLVYRGICSLPDECMPPQKLMFRWMVNIDRIEQRNKNMNLTLLNLTRELEAMGMKPVVLKGQGIASLYEEPGLRECGDIDLYYPNEVDRIKAEEWIRKQGVILESKADGSTSYFLNQIEVEHHPELFDLQTPKVQGFLKALVSEKGLTWMEIDGKGKVSVPSPLLNLLLLNTHILKHAMGKGIGLRQLCDMARAYAVLGKEVDGEELRCIYRKTGIGKWSRLLHAFLVDILGMPEAYLPYREEKRETAAPLWNIVLRGGNFGQNGEAEKSMNGPIWLRKWHTCQAFLKNARFSLKYAPDEAMHTFGQLIKGQF